MEQSITSQTIGMIKTIIFDWKRTLYDPDKRTLIKGSIELLGFLKSKRISMVLMGKGGKDMYQEVSRLGVKNYFNHVIFAEGTKDPKVFIPHISSTDPGKTVFIGDRTRSEPEIGKKLGAKTIWVKQGKFANEESEDSSLQPDHTVTSLTSCLQFLQKIKFESN